MKFHGAMVCCKRTDGRERDGYLSPPDDQTRAPAVLVLQKWWGFNDQIRGVADQLASARYFTLVPDPYHGEMTVEEEEANHPTNSLDFDEVTSQDDADALQYLGTKSNRIASMGYCMGDALTLLALCHHPALTAVGHVEQRHCGHTL